MDIRHQCPKFLSAECPNNCHYDDWCKHLKFFNNAEKMFVLHHLDLGVSEEEIDDLIYESTFQSRLNWLDKSGYTFEG